MIFLLKWLSQSGEHKKMQLKNLIAKLNQDKKKVHWLILTQISMHPYKIYVYNMHIYNFKKGYKQYNGL